MSGLADWFSIFRSGAHVSSDGVKRTFSHEDLDAIIARYEGQTPSPCVITHEELYSPFAWAQIAQVRREGDVLEARCDPETIEPQFAELVGDGRLYARSVQLLPESEGGWRLGHVAFLGAEPPAVSGLDPIPFTASGVTYTAEEAWEKADDKRSLARIWSVLRELAEKVFGSEKADRIVSQWEVDSAHEDVGRAAAKAQQQEGKTSMEGTANAEELAAEKTRLDEERRTLADDRLKFARTQSEARVKGLIDAGKITAAQADGLADFAARLDAAAEGPIEFSRGGETVKITPSEHLFSLLEGMPASSPLGGEIAGGRRSDGVGLTDSGEIRRKALEYQAEERLRGRIVGNAAAVAHVTGRTA